MQKIVASDRASSDLFGRSVSISGDYAIVGAYLEDQDASGVAPLASAGSAYIFKNNAGTWTQVQKIVASDRAASDQFGNSVSLSGDYAIVGASQEDENASGGENATDAGSAYIFKNNAGTWTQVQKIVASDRAALDFFGWSVSISGDYAIVGAYAEDEDASGGANATFAGSAYIFKKDQGGVDNWGQVQKIVASDRAANDLFGHSVSISGDYAIVGAYFEDEDASGGATASEAGSAYIFALPAEINLKQNTTNIASGGNYDFGNVNINASSSDISFTIENTGGQNLTITGTAGSLVVLGGTNASEFSVVQSSVTSPITGGSNKTFTVKFSPTSAGAKTATLTISSNDADEGTYTVNLTGTGTKINQTITFGTLTAKTVGDANFDLTATASSGLTVTYTSSNTAVATISGKTVTIVGAGTTEITASQAGNGTYNAATDVKQTLTVNTVTVTSISDVENEAITPYPNPTEDKIMIDNLPLGKTTFVLSDAMGNEILAGETEGNLELDLSFFPSGVYTLTLNTSKGVFTKKIVKK